jgi:tetratricopeptide (TPR) repeat protein
MVDTLRATGRLSLRDGCWQLSGGTQLPLPASIQALMVAQVGRLSAASAQLVRLCAVLGDRLTYPVVAAATDLPEGALLDELDALIAAGLLEETVHGYVFHHPLLPEVMYQSLPTRRRSVLHRRAGEALQACYAGQTDEHAAALAWHFGEAACHEQAAHFGEVAGDQAAAAYATPEAMAQYLQADVHLEPLSSTGDPVWRAARSRVDEKMGDLLILDGNYAGAQQHFVQARALATEAGRQAELWRKESATWEKRGEYAQGLAALDAAMDLGEADVPPAIRASLDVSRGEIYFRQGQFEAAEVIVAQAVAALRDEPPGPASANAYQLLGDIVYERNDQARASDCFQRGLAIREQIGDEHGIAVSWNGEAIVAYDRGDYERAVECSRRSLAIRERIGDQWGIGSCWNNLGNVAYDRGDLRTALESYERSRAIWEVLGEQRALAATWNNLGAVAQGHGDLARAERSYQQSLEIRVRIGEQPALGGVWTNLGNIAALRGNLAQAEDCFGRALAILEKTGPLEYLAGTLIGVGDLACQRGDFSAALIWYRKARGIARRATIPDTEGLALLGLARAHLRYPAWSERRLRLTSAQLARAQELAVVHGLAEVRVEAALVDAELQLRQGAGDVARVAAEEALRLAISGQRRLTEAFARRLIAQCALAGGSVTEGAAALHPVEQRFAELGAELEAARTSALHKAANDPVLGV